MKKSLSLLLAFALVFSLFANVVSAAETQPSLEEMYQALVEEGVFTPYPDGDPRFDELTTRGQFAKIVTLVGGLEPIEGTYTFNDKNYTKHWARPYVEAVYAAGLMQGKDLVKMIFGVNDNITIEEIAKVLATILGIKPVENAPAKAGVSKWAYGWVKALEDAGYVLTTGAYNVPAKRSLLVEVAYAAWQVLSVQVESVKVLDSKTVEVTFSDGGVVKVELEKALEPNVETTINVEYKGFVYKVSVKMDKVLVDKVAQTGAKKITVTFNRALTAEEKAALSYELKFNTINYPVTVTYAEDNKSVDLVANYLPSGEYTLTVKGFDPFKVKVEEAKATKLEIGATTLQLADNQDLKVKVLNQFGEEINYVSPTITAYGPRGQITVSGGKVNLASDPQQLKVDETVVVTAIYQGLATSKSFKLVDPSAATTVSLGQVVPTEGKTRISVGDTGLVLPYTFTDQYGQKVLLSGTPVVSGNTIKFGDIQFSVTNPDIIKPNSFKVDSNGVLTFDTGNTAGVVTILVVNLKTGANASTTVTVQEAAGKVAKFELSNPGVLIVAGEEVTFPYNAVDNYGAPIAPAEFAKPATNGQVKFTATGGATLASVKWTAKGELKLKFTGKGTSFILVQDKNGLLLSQLTVDVKEASKPERIIGLKGLPTVLGITGEATVNTDTLNVIDNYGRSVGSLPGGYSLSVVSKNTDIVTVNGNKLVGKAEGTATIEVTLNGSSVADNKFTFDVRVVKDEDIASFEIKDIPTLYGYGANNGASPYAKGVEVVGKTSAGQEVAINQSKYVVILTSSDQNVVGVDNAAKKIFGKAKGSATVAVWDSKGNKLDEVTVNVSDVAPYASSVKIEDGAADITITGAKQLKLEVKDQYGVAIAGNGFWTTSDAAKVTVDQNGNVAPAANAKNGDSATITFVTNTGVSASIVVFVEK